MYTVILYAHRFHGINGSTYVVTYTYVLVSEMNTEKRSDTLRFHETLTFIRGKFGSGSTTN